MPANPATSGIATLTNELSDLRPFDVSKEAILVTPEETKLTTLLSSTGRIRKTDFEFKIIEQPTPPSYITVVTVPDGTSITVSAEDALLLAANTPLRVNSSTVRLVSAVSGTTITVDSSGGMGVGDKVPIGARAFEENSATPAQLTWTPTARVAYQQTSRFAWGNSRWMQLIKEHLTETRVVRDRKMAMLYAKRIIEQGLIFNQKQKVTGPPIRYYSGGLYDQNTTNIFDVEGDGTLTYSMLEDVLTSMKFSGDMLWGLCAPEVASVVRKIVWQKNQNAVVEGGYMGVGWTDIRCGNKKVRLYDSHNLVGTFATHLHLIDKRYVRVTTTEDMVSGKAQWFLLQTDAQTPGTDGQVNILTTDFGLELAVQDAHALVRNIVHPGVE